MNARPVNSQGPDSQPVAGLIDKIGND